MGCLIAASSVCMWFAVLADVLECVAKGNQREQDAKLAFYLNGPTHVT